MTLLLPQRVLMSMRKEAEAAYPDECCGLLIGTSGEGGVHVLEAVSSDNMAADPGHHFEVDPALHLRWQRELRGSARHVIGHYHSHPDSAARPSARDAASIADPAMLWVILAVAGGKAVSLPTVWQVRDGGGGFTEIKFAVV